MGDIFGDYLKFKGITFVGVLLYPILAPLILGYAAVFLLKMWIANKLERPCNHKHIKFTEERGYYCADCNKGGKGFEVKG